MPDVATVLTEAYTALGSIGPSVRMDDEPDPGADEVIVLVLVSDTTRPVYGGAPTDKRVQVTCYAATQLRALALTELVKAALRPLGLRHLQSRVAPDPDSLGVLSDFRR